MKISVSNYSEAHDQPRISKKLFHYSLPVQLRDETLKKKRKTKVFYFLILFIYPFEARQSSWPARALQLQGGSQHRQVTCAFKSFLKLPTPGESFLLCLRHKEERNRKHSNVEPCSHLFQTSRSSLSTNPLWLGQDKESFLERAQRFVAHWPDHKHRGS